MRIETNESGDINLTEVYNPVLLTTNSGEKLMVVMRDSGFEVCYNDQYFSLNENKIRRLRFTSV